MTQREFDAAVERGGFKSQGVFGYYRLPVPGTHVSVSILNAGPRRRDQIAYLHEQTARCERELSRS